MPSGTGVYCDDRSSPEVRECAFSRNYHHASFSQNATGRVTSCTMADSMAEAVECYWNSTPLLEDVKVTGSKASDLYLRNGSRPRFVGGTPLSTWRVFANATDRTCYAIAGKWVQVEVLDLRGRPLVGANVSIIGASNVVLSKGTTGETGRAAHMLMSMYTMGPKGADDRENPQTVSVTLDNSTELFIVTPRELTSEGVLVVVMHVSPFGPAGGASLLWVVVIAVVIAVVASASAAIIVARRRRAAHPPRGHGRGRRQMSK
jgi:hypothetical protein